MKLIFKPQKSALLTYLGVIFAVIGMYCVLNGLTVYSLICLVLAGFFDIFDGSFARMFKRTNTEKQFGIQIDSLADVVNFAALPSLIFLQITDGFLALFAVVVFVICGITRLGVFNVLANEGSAGEFRGVPITLSALVLPLIFFMEKYVFNGSFNSIVAPCILLILALLFIVDLRIKKPRSMLDYSLICVIIVTIFGGLYANL